MIQRGISFFAYDTLCKVNVQAETTDRADGLVNAVRSIALDIQSSLNMFDPESELSRLCAEYVPHTEYPVSNLLYDFLGQNLAFSEHTGGVFDCTVGPLVRLWDFLADQPRVPTQVEIRTTAARVGYRHVHLNPETNHVWFDAPGIVIDPGAGGKGYALELCARYLKDAGVTHGLLDFGGNLYLIGGNPALPNDPPWRVALIDPDDTESYYGTVALMDCGIASSSWYEHSFEKNGVIYHHLLDPFSGTPRPLDLKSVSILSSSGALTDFLSTAFFLLGAQKGALLVDRLAQESGEYIGYVALTSCREILVSGNVMFHERSNPESSG